MSTLRPPGIIHVMNDTGLSLSSLFLHFRVLLSTQTEEQKQGGPGNKAKKPDLFSHVTNVASFPGFSIHEQKIGDFGTFCCAKKKRQRQRQPNKL